MASPSLPERFEKSLPALALAVVGVFALRRLDDFDTWWHLAAGRWIVSNGSVPGTDVLSYTVPGNEWINLQWLYDVLLYATWSVGGASALVLLSAACFTGAFAILARNVARHLGPVGTALLLAWMAMTVNERFLIRPEMASFPLLAAVQVVLAEGRSTPSRLRLLVPLMLLWANTHSLFILGAGAVACAVAGAFVAELPLLPAAWRRDAAWPREARTALGKWGAAALAATLVNPYFVRAWLFPLELMSRIDGSSGVYQSIGEFRRPFSGYFDTLAIGSYQVFFFAFLAVAALAALLRAFARAPRGRAAAAGDAGAGQAGAFDVGAVVFALALAYLSLMARRNVGVFAIGAAPVFAACTAVLLRALSSAWGAAWSSRSPGRPSAGAARPGSVVSQGMAAATLALFVGVSASVASNDWYAATGETHEFGLGVFDANFQSRATAFFREQGLPGPLYNDMTAGGWLTWDDPTGKGVYIDGRLEVYDTPFFSAYMGNLADINAWRRDADARGVQSVMVFHRWGNRHTFLRLLLSRPDWALVYYDETAAIAVRATPENTARIQAARQAFATAWRQKTDAKLAGPTLSAPWQWGIERYTAQIAYARILETLGEPREALRWIEAAIAVGMPHDFELDARRRAAGLQAQAGQYAQARMHLEKALALQPGDENTTAMLERLDQISR